MDYYIKWKRAGLTDWEHGIVFKAPDFKAAFQIYHLIEMAMRSVITEAIQITWYVDELGLVKSLGTNVLEPVKRNVLRIRSPRR